MIDPRGMSLVDWADSLVLLVNGQGWAFGRVTNEADWQDWAVGFVRAGGLATRTLPDPHAFTDWRKWAERVYPMLEAPT